MAEQDDIGIAIEERREAITRENKRSMVRRRVTYALTVTYVVVAGALILGLGYAGIFKNRPQALETALSLFSGLSAAALGVIGYWFGSRGLMADKVKEEEPEPEPQPEDRDTKSNGGETSQSVLAVIPEEKLNRAYQKALELYGDREDVTAIDKGFKYKDEKRTDQLVLRLHVRQKKPDTDLDSKDVFPKEIMGVPVDVIETEFGPQQQAPGLPPRGDRREPIQPGISIGRKGKVGTVGTFGLVVYDKRESFACILSNAHVLAGAKAKKGDPITQPGNSASKDDVVATLERWVHAEKADAAIARLNGSRAVHGDVFGIELILAGARMPKCGEEVAKSGLMTGVTQGIVDGEGFYKGQDIHGFKIVPKEGAGTTEAILSEEGDSGSVWYSPQTGEALGLHVRGNHPYYPEAAYACAMPTVLKLLDATMAPAQINIA